MYYAFQDDTLGLLDILDDVDDRIVAATVFGSSFHSSQLGAAELMIDMAAKGLNTPRFCARLMLLAATHSGKPIPAAVRRWIEAFKRYGLGKLNKSTWTNYEAAARDGNHAEWDHALAVEWSKMVDMGVFVWVDPLPGDKQLGLTTPSRYKAGEDLHASQYKVRICAQGSSEQLMLQDGTEIETFCPTISTSDLVLFFNVALCRKLKVVQQDLVSAYLHSELCKLRELLW